LFHAIQILFAANPFFGKHFSQEHAEEAVDMIGFKPAFISDNRVLSVSAASNSAIILPVVDQ